LIDKGDHHFPSAVELRLGEKRGRFPGSAYWVAPWVPSSL
jgi:hypothetical protein